MREKNYETPPAREIHERLKRGGFPGGLLRSRTPVHSAAAELVVYRPESSHLPQYRDNNSTSTYVWLPPRSFQPSRCATVALVEDLGRADDSPSPPTPHPRVDLTAPRVVSFVSPTCTVNFPDNQPHNAPSVKLFDRKRLAAMISRGSSVDPVAP